MRCLQKNPALRTTPLVADVPAVGKTPTMLAEVIRLQLTQYIAEPLMTVTVNKFAGTFTPVCRRSLERLATPSAVRSAAAWPAQRARISFPARSGRSTRLCSAARPYPSAMQSISAAQAAIGARYDRRRFIAAPGTVIAAVTGVVDESYWAAAYANTQLDQRSSISANATTNWFGSGFNGEAIGYSASLAYYRKIIAGLSGTAALGLGRITRGSLRDIMSASALVGLRYSF